MRLGGEHCADRAVVLYRKRFAKDGLFENSKYSGIDELLSKIKNMGVVLNVVSSKSLVFVERILRHFELAEYLSQVFGSQRSEALADKADLLAHALDETGHAASRCVMVGDRKHDAIGARARGMRAWGVVGGCRGQTSCLSAAGALTYGSDP